MIQVDVFWSFAMGASLATLAGDRLKESTSIFANKYFAYTVFYLGVIFSPSGVYLLWQHTGWETMFFYGRNDLHGLAVCVFASTNVLLGVIGFYCCAWLVRSGRQSVAHAVWTTSYSCMFSILSFGYDRFLYAGTLQQWRTGVQFPLSDFFECEVFYTLLIMSVFVLPPLYYAMVFWPAGKEMDDDRKTEMLRDAVTPYVRLTGFTISGFLVLFFTGMLPLKWHIDRVVVYFAGQSFFGALIFTPLYLVKTTPPGEVTYDNTSSSDRPQAQRRATKKAKTN